MTKEPRTITLQDIPGALTFLKFRGIDSIILTKGADGRVVGEVPASPEVYELLSEFRDNPSVPLIEFLAVQRRLRGQMLDLRNKRENGRRQREMTHEQET